MYWALALNFDAFNATSIFKIATHRLAHHHFLPFAERCVCDEMLSLSPSLRMRSLSSSSPSVRPPARRVQCSAVHGSNIFIIIVIIINSIRRLFVSHCSGNRSTPTCSLHLSFSAREGGGW